MKKRWIYVLAVTLLLSLVSLDAMALQKSRSKKKASRTSVKKKTSSKASRARTKTAQRRSRSKSRRSRKATVARANTSKVPAERVTEIQAALIKAGYMSGEPSGEYDNATIEAMKRYQSDNGLQKTGRPSAHSLKKLGVSKRNNDGYAVPIKKTESEENKDADKNQ